MRTAIFWAGVMLTLLAAISAMPQVANPAQAPNSQSPQAPTGQTPKLQNPGNPLGPKAPDMVCFGNNPRWSIQFMSWGARYLGINEPDREFAGGFNWVPDQQVWAWQLENPASNAHGLSAFIKQASCKSSVATGTFPYSAHVNLPEGDIVDGCCRRLRADEAPVGPHGVPPSSNAPPK